MGVPKRELIEPMFGEPVLRSGGVGKVGWVKDTGNVESLFQKGTSGYLANLEGGSQGGTDWAAVFIPVREMFVTDFNSALWTYHFTSAKVYGVNIVIWIHDPNDNDKRVEVTQAPSHAGLARADARNAHELDTTVSQFFFYGENTTGTGLTAGTQYTWEQFQADALFKGWTIYRISLEHGWYSTGTFDDVWVIDVKLNGQVIPLRPRVGEPIGRETKSVYLATSSVATEDVAIIVPAPTKRVRIKNVFITTTTATVYNYEVYFSVAGSMPASKVIAFKALGTDKDSSVSIPYGDDGPLGEIGEHVSIRVSSDVTNTGAFVIIYKEE